MRYKYFYNKRPLKCPICGADFLLDTVYDKSFVGLKRINDKLVWGCPDNETHLLNAKLCYCCGQPVFFNNCEVDDSDYFYIYLGAFLGWQGLADKICIAVNQTTGDTSCSVFEHGKHRSIELDEEFKSWIKNNIYSLLHYTSKEEESDWYDVDVYFFKMFANHESNEFSFQSPYKEKHPLFSRLVDLILKTNEGIK